MYPDVPLGHIVGHGPQAVTGRTPSHDSANQGSSTAGELETETTRSHTMSDLGERLTLEAEGTHDPPTALRRPGRSAGMLEHAAGNSELHSAAS